MLVVGMEGVYGVLVAVFVLLPVAYLLPGKDVYLHVSSLHTIFFLDTRTTYINLQNFEVPRFKSIKHAWFMVRCLSWNRFWAICFKITLSRALRLRNGNEHQGMMLARLRTPWILWSLLHPAMKYKEYYFWLLFAHVHTTWPGCMWHVRTWAFIEGPKCSAMSALWVTCPGVAEACFSFAWTSDNVYWFVYLQRYCSNERLRHSGDCWRDAPLGILRACTNFPLSTSRYVRYSKTYEYDCQHYS